MKIYNLDTGRVVEPAPPPKPVPVPAPRQRVRRTFKTGLADFRRVWPASLLLWLVGLLGALVPTVMVGRVVNLDIGHSLLADKLMPDFDPVWFAEFVHLHAPRLEAVPLIAILAAFGVALIHLLVLGGALDQLIQGDPFRLRRLIRAGVGHLPALLLLTLCFLPFLAVVLLVDRGVAFLLRVPLERISTEFFAICLRFLRPLIFILLFISYRVVLDYARLLLIGEPGLSPFKVMKRAWRFVSRRLTAFLPLPSGLAALLVLMGVHAAVSALIHPAGPFTTVVLILWQNLFLVVCLGIRLLVYSWESALLEIDESAPSES